jgi:hypothetical protein
MVSNMSIITFFFREVGKFRANVYLEDQAMESYRQELWFNVPGRRAFINITPQVRECLQESDITEGLILCKTKGMQL